MRSTIKDRHIKGSHVLVDTVPLDKPGQAHIVECHRCRENVAAFDGAFHDVDEAGKWVSHRHQPQGWMATWSSGNAVSKAKLEPKDYWGS